MDSVLPSENTQNQLQRGVELTGSLAEMSISGVLAIVAAKTFHRYKTSREKMWMRETDN